MSIPKIEKDKSMISYIFYFDGLFYVAYEFIKQSCYTDSHNNK